MVKGHTTAFWVMLTQQQRQPWSIGLGANHLILILFHALVQEVMKFSRLSSIPKSLISNKPNLLLMAGDTHVKAKRNTNPSILFYRSEVRLHPKLIQNLNCYARCISLTLEQCLRGKTSTVTNNNHAAHLAFAIVTLVFQSMLTHGGMLTAILGLDLCWREEALWLVSSSVQRSSYLTRHLLSIAFDAR